MPLTYGYRFAAGALFFVALTAAPLAPVPAALAQETAAATPDQTDDDDTDPLSEDELEVLVARIALYPDELVALVTSASLYPLQIIEASRYLEQVKKDKDLKPKGSWDG